VCERFDLHRASEERVLRVNVQVGEFWGHRPAVDRARAPRQHSTQQGTNQASEFSSGSSGLCVKPPIMSSPSRRFWPFLLLTALSVGACDQKDPGALPEWSPSDHDNQENPQAGQVDTSNPRPGMPNLEQYGLNDLILATWKQNCVPCHGVIGRGDGPQGVAVRPRDLTDPEWQRVAIDSEIAHTIKKGRGRMPAFAQIPEDTVMGLVRLVRMLNAGRVKEDGPPAPSPSATQE
jgi:mono/diheme cytochrome c family protein